MPDDDRPPRARYEAKIQRGTDTRDQETVYIEVEGSSTDEALEMFAESIAEVRERHIPALRDIDPERTAGTACGDCGRELAANPYGGRYCPYCENPIEAEEAEGD